MPYVNVVTNLSVSKEKEEALAGKLGPAIEVIPGKLRTNLFIRVEGEAGLYFGGSNACNCAMVSIELFGKSNGKDLSAYSAKVCEALLEILEIPPENVYISFTECRHWGGNSSANTADFT